RAPTARVWSATKRLVTSVCMPCHGPLFASPARNGPTEIRGEALRLKRDFSGMPPDAGYAAQNGINAWNADMAGPIMLSGSEWACEHPLSDGRYRTSLACELADPGRQCCQGPKGKSRYRPRGC